MQYLTVNNDVMDLTIDSKGIINLDRATDLLRKIFRIFICAEGTLYAPYSALNVSRQWH